MYSQLRKSTIMATYTTNCTFLLAAYKGRQQQESQSSPAPAAHRRTGPGSDDLYGQLLENLDFYEADLAGLGTTALPPQSDWWRLKVLTSSCYLRGMRDGCAAHVHARLGGPQDRGTLGGRAEGSRETERPALRQGGRGTLTHQPER